MPDHYKKVTVVALRCTSATAGFLVLFYGRYGDENAIGL